MNKSFKTYYLIMSNLKLRLRQRNCPLCFKIRDRNKIQHKHDTVYYVKCPMKIACVYGEERVSEHNGRDINSHLA